MPDERCLIVGAGPAGLTAAHELSKLGIPAVVFERDDIVGGISRTAQYRGYRFDIGGHRFFTKVQLVRDLWNEILPDDLLVRPRLSRIFYDDKFFDYPLKPMNALLSLGPIETVRIIASYLYARVLPDPHERTFDQWVSNRFGSRLYEIFFRTYTEKVWGIPCSEIEADWAAQRIKDLDLVAAVRDALLGSRGSKKVVASLIEEFHYPRLGPGMMWERCAEILAARGYPTHLSTEVVRIDHDGGRVVGIIVRDADGFGFRLLQYSVQTKPPASDRRGPRRPGALPWHAGTCGARGPGPEQVLGSQGPGLRRPLPRPDPQDPAGGAQRPGLRDPECPPPWSAPRGP